MQGSGVLCTLLQRHVARLDERGCFSLGKQKTTLQYVFTYVSSCILGQHHVDMAFFNKNYSVARLDE